LTKAFMFLAFENVRHAHAEGPDKAGADDGISGVRRTMPTSAALLLIGGLTLVGSPPGNIFLSSLMIFYGALTVAQTASHGWVFERSLWIAIGVFVIGVAAMFAGLVLHLGR